MDGKAEHSIALQDYINMVRRRKWIVIAVAVLVPMAAFVLAKSEEPAYEASAKVLLSRQSLANALTGLTDPNSSVTDATLVTTQADVARAPEIATEVLAALDVPDLTPEQFLEQSSVSTELDTQVLTFAVTDGDPAFASEAATEYADQYTRYRHKLDTAPLKNARVGVSRRLEQLQEQGETDGPLYNSLLARVNKLQTLQALQTSNAQLFQPASEATQVSPKPMRDTLIGLILGLVLGLGVAFLRDALDTRVRSADEICESLGLPLLARLPAPRKELAVKGSLVTLEEPRGQHAEAFRMLRTNLEFAMVDGDVRSIMVTSALAGEGKSTTVANLALAFARAGRSVALVDLDLRKPRLGTFFDLKGKPGMTQVVLGRSSLDEALVRVPILPTGPGWPATDSHEFGLAGVGVNGGGGTLEVVGSGPIPPDPGEFVASHAVERILLELKERVDIVLIDSPPLLHVGDAMTVSALTDAFVLVARLQMLHRAAIIETHRLLSRAQARPLGFVLAGAETEVAYGYGDPYVSHQHESMGVS